MNDLLKHILTRADLRDGAVFSADEVRKWPNGALSRFLSLGLLREIEPAQGLVCDQCEQACWIEPQVRTNPRTGRTVGVYVCKSNPDVGRFEIHLSRLRQWDLNMHGLAEAVGKALSVDWSVEETVKDRLYRLGQMTLVGQSCDVFLARGLMWSDAQSEIGQAKRFQSARNPLLLSPSILAPKEILKSGVPLSLVLTDIIYLNDTGIMISRGSLEALRTSKKRKPRRASSQLTQREEEAYTLIHVRNLSQQQAAIEMKCSKQNVSSLLKKAEGKMAAARSRSISATKTTALPTDEDGQVTVGDGHTSQLRQKHTRRKT